MWIRTAELYQVIGCSDSYPTVHILLSDARYASAHKYLASVASYSYASRTRVRKRLSALRVPGIMTASRQCRYDVTELSKSPLLWGLWSLATTRTVNLWHRSHDRLRALRLISRLTNRSYGSNIFQLPAPDEIQPRQLAAKQIVNFDLTRAKIVPLAPKFNSAPGDKNTLNLAYVRILTRRHRGPINSRAALGLVSSTLKLYCERQTQPALEIDVLGKVNNIPRGEKLLVSGMKYPPVVSPQFKVHENAALALLSLHAHFQDDGCDEPRRRIHREATNNQSIWDLYHSTYWDMTA
ncbi:hypothetical protein IW262DRAFT_1293246 [Armillaria fumosa]|nr:hypothetical protein IW262DRAFT_1293246 [Armillaria fumosa]